METRPKRFEVTPEHVKLLRRAYVGWDPVEYGAPAIDGKRPYGNSDVLSDVAEIIGLRPEFDSQGEFTPEILERLDRLHRETQIVLQIVLSVGYLAPGVYEKVGQYGVEYKPVAEDGDEGRRGLIADAHGSLEVAFDSILAERDRLRARATAAEAALAKLARATLDIEREWREAAKPDA